MSKYHWVEDENWIEREGSLARVYNCDGETVAAFSDRLSDEQVRSILRYMDTAYREGYQHGSDDHARELRGLLRVGDEINDRLDDYERFGV